MQLSRPLFGPDLDRRTVCFPTTGSTASALPADGVNVVSNLGMQTASLENILTAAREQGAATDLLDRMLELFRKRAGAGFGDEDISGAFELIRRKSGASG